MGVRDLIGKRGEAIATARLLDFCGRAVPYFDPHPLGEKCPTFDFLVELVDAGPARPYFLVQVKTTTQGASARSRTLPIALKAEDVQTMVRCPLPTYLIGVDEQAEEAYILSIHGNRSRAITQICTKHPLNASNLKKLSDEVRAQWRKLNPSRKTSSFTF